MEFSWNYFRATKSPRHRVECVGTTVVEGAPDGTRAIQTAVIVLLRLPQRLRRDATLAPSPGVVVTPQKADVSKRGRGVPLPFETLLQQSKIRNTSMIQSQIHFTINLDTESVRDSSWST